MTILPWIVTALTLAGVVAVAIPLFRRPQQQPANGPEDPVVRGGRAQLVLPSPPEERKKVLAKRTTRDDRVKIRDRLVQAGLYRDDVVDLMRVARFAVLALAILGGYLLSSSGVITGSQGVSIGLIGGIGATVAPAFLLDYLKVRRQTAMRRALPDALDVIVVCLEAGLSLPSSFSRVSRELADAHPTLALELRIVEREVQMGLSLGEAMRNFAKRFDLEELRSLASVVVQADRYGASVSRAFKVFAGSMRLRRQQRAEERAHKAAVKLAIPTALFIFPAMLVVTLAPAVYAAFEVLVPLFENVKLPPS